MTGVFDRGGVFPGTGEPFVGASAGTNGQSGSVPAPVAGEQALFLRGDGTWASGGAAVGYQTIQKGGVSVAQETTLNFIGAGVTVADNPGSSRTDVTIASSAFPYTNENSNITMTVNNGYTISGGALVTLTLPAVIPYGSVFKIAGLGAGGWKVAQNAGQTIFFSASSTTTGVGGSVASSNNTGCIELVCAVANTTLVITSAIGTLNIT